MVKVKKELIIEGNKVHDVGYRLFLMDKAEELLITNFNAKNNTTADNKQQVIVHISGEENIVNEFIEIVKKEHPPDAEVDNNGPKVLEYKKDIRTLESYSRSFSASQLSKMVTTGVTMKNGVKEMSVSMKEMKVGIDSFHEDTITRFDTVDTKYGQISATMGTIVLGMNNRDELFEKKFLAIEKNIEALLQILSRQK